MTAMILYLVGALVTLGLLTLGALLGFCAGERQERKRCGDLVKEHLCGDCYSRHCLLKLASQILLRVVNENGK